MIRLAVEHLPGRRRATPAWLWSSTSGADADPEQITRCRQTYLRRFDPMHAFPPGLPRRSTPSSQEPMDMAGHRCPHPASPDPPFRR